MPGKRTTELPLGDDYLEYFFWNSFFDEQVQSVLMTRKNLNYKLPKFQKSGTNSFLLSWPIKAYKEITYLVYDYPKYWQENFFGTFYNWDPKFIADLLRAVTDYKNKPESDWDLTRALENCPRRGHAETKYKNANELNKALARFTSQEKRNSFWRFVDECPDGSFTISNQHRIILGDCPPEGLDTERLFDYKQIAKIIGKNFPHLRSELDVQDQKGDGTKRRTTPADKLRTYFARHVKLRQRIKDDWESNFSAEERVVIPDDLTKLPCFPSPDFYL